MFSMELPLHESFFFQIYSLLLAPWMLPNFMRKQARSWKNKNIGAFFHCLDYFQFCALQNSNLPMFSLELLFHEICFENLGPSHNLNDAVFHA